MSIIPLNTDNSNWLALLAYHVPHKKLPALAILTDTFEPDTDKAKSFLDTDNIPAQPFDIHPYEQLYTEAHHKFAPVYAFYRIERFNEFSGAYERDFSLPCLNRFPSLSAALEALETFVAPYNPYDYRIMYVTYTPTEVGTDV